MCGEAAQKRECVGRTLSSSSFSCLSVKDMIGLVHVQDLAASVDDVDVGKFTDVVKEYDSMSRLVSLSFFPTSSRVRRKGVGQQVCRE